MSEQDEYTPSVDEVRHGLIAGQIALARGAVDDPDTVAIQSECGKQFDRMIERVRREAAAEQRERDAQAAEGFRLNADVETVVGLSWNLDMDKLIAAIREQGTDEPAS